MKKYQSFYLKKIQFLEVKFSIYLNRRVFVMKTSISIPTNSSFPTDCSSAAPLLYFSFVCASVITYVAFVVSLLFQLCSSGGLCFLIVAFSGYLHLY